MELKDAPETRLTQPINVKPAGVRDARHECGEP
jgi:hypothetical protein